MVGDFHIPTGFDGPPALLKLDGIGFRQVGFGIALHVDNAKLDVGAGEQAGRDRRQTGKVVVNDNHDAAKATLNQPAQDELPILEILTAWSRNAGQDLFLAVTAQPDDDVNTLGPQLVAIAGPDRL